jgi:flagellar basal-body rod protein FlgC
MSLFNSLSVSASGLTAQRQRAEVLVENIANADTTRTANGGPYRRQDVIFEAQPVGQPFSSVFQDQLDDQPKGVAISQIVVDQSEPDRRYLPGHPDADQDGYVSYPKVNPAEDMVDLLGASRAYQANVSAISAVKDMINRSMDLFR